MTRKLTARQTAVLAALERRGRANLLDLRDDFPDLAPSAVGAVLTALEGRGLVRRTGDPAQVYLGGVEFWAARRTPDPEGGELDALVTRIQDEGWQARADYDRAIALVRLPIEAVHDALGSSTGQSRFDSLGRLIADLSEAELIASTGMSSDITIEGGVPSLEVELGLRGPTDEELERLEDW